MKITFFPSLFLHLISFSYIPYIFIPFNWSNDLLSDNLSLFYWPMILNS